MSKKSNTRALTQQKRHRRQWLTFARMCSYGLHNLSRNLWLTVAATAVMTITLLIIFSTVVAQVVLNDSIQDINRKIDMSIYLSTHTTDDQAESVMRDLRLLSNVQSISYTSPADAKKQLVNDKKSDPMALDAINDAVNQLPGTIRIGLKNVNDPSQLEEFVNTDKNLKQYISTDIKPSFAGDRRTAIKNLTKSVDFAQRVGWVASSIFIVISSLIVFNTIRMAIFNRRDEIEMMKLIGANRSFIRGPFVVEAVVYGIISAIIAVLVGVVIIMVSAPSLERSGVIVGPALEYLTLYSPLVLLAMCSLGALIGTISSLLATRKYLKII